MEPLSTIKFQLGIPTIGPPGPTGPTGTSAPAESMPGPSWIAGNGILSYLSVESFPLDSNAVRSVLGQGPIVIPNLSTSAFFLNANVNFFASSASYVMTIGRSTEQVYFTNTPIADQTINIADGYYLTSNITVTSNTNILASAIDPLNESVQPISLSCQFIDTVTEGTYYYNVFIGNSGSSNTLLNPYGQLGVLQVKP